MELPVWPLTRPRFALGGHREVHMRGLGSFVGLLLVVLIAGFLYRYNISQTVQSTGRAATPTQTIDTIGVQNDLLAIAQAERIYQAQNSSYGSLDDLVSSGAMALKKTGRDGYTYDVETSTDGFRVVAHCPTDTFPGCTNYAVDQTMQVHATP